MIRVPAAALAALLLVLPCSAAGGAKDGEAAELLFAAMEAEEPDRGALRGGLRALGPDAIPELFGILAEGAVRNEAGETRALTAAFDAAVLAVLTGQPLGLLRDFLDTVSASQAPEPERRTAMRVLAEVGTEQDILLLIHLASPPAEEVGVPRSRRAVFEDSLGRILEREPKGAWALRSHFSDSEASLLAPMVRRIGALGTEDALHVLSTLLSRVGEADPIVLSEIAKIGDEVPHPVDEFVLTNVRSHLRGNDSTTVRLAMQALASLEDYDAAAALVQCLEHEDQNIRDTAGDALRKITSRNFRTEYRKWDTWYRDEMQWWTKESAACFRDLSSRDSTKALRAILEIGQHGMYRHELAQALAPVLERREPELVILACSTLGHFRSHGVVASLVDLLDHRDEEISSAAWSALKRITGRELPPDREQWSAAL